jgi:hypothetical protein
MGSYGRSLHFLGDPPWVRSMRTGQASLHQSRHAVAGTEFYSPCLSMPSSESGPSAIFLQLGQRGCA